MDIGNATVRDHPFLALLIVLAAPAVPLAPLFLFSLAVYFGSPPGLVDAHLPPSDEPVWFQCLVAETPSGVEPLDISEPGCPGPRPPVPPDQSWIAFKVRRVPTADRQSVRWQDDGRVGLLRKHGADAWSLRWYDPSDLRWEVPIVGYDDVFLPAESGTDAEPPSAGFLRTLGLDRAIGWTPPGWK